LRGAPEDYDVDTYDGNRHLKLNAAQKRQINRDRRRKQNGATRTTAQDMHERFRKHNQANNRGRDRVDPYEPGFGNDEFIRLREAYRAEDCYENGGWACGWNGIDWDTTKHGGRDRDIIHGQHYPYEPVMGDNWYYDDFNW
jgi:hypothetical protein